MFGFILDKAGTCCLLTSDLELIPDSFLFFLSYLMESIVPEFFFIFYFNVWQFSVYPKFLSHLIQSGS